MPTPQPRYGPRRSTTHLANPPQSRWTARRKALAALPTGGIAPPTPAYIISGTPTPDCTGPVYPDGPYNGQPSFALADDSFYLWYNSTFALYMISTTKGVYTQCWFQEGPTITSTYAPFGGYGGQAIVSTPP